MISSHNRNTLESFTACLHNFFNPYNLCKYIFFKLLAHPTFDLFAFEQNLCPICFSKIFIPTYSKNCSHIFCFCCIYRWLIKKSNCPIFRKKISQIGYMSSDSKGGTIFINISDIIIKNEDNLSNYEDSKCCIKCKKNEPCNQLLLCHIYKFSLTHIICGNIDLNQIHKFICFNCKKD